MDTIVTLSERKTGTAERLKSAAEAVISEMRDYARTHGGRFYVFGSVVANRLRYDSDLDVLIDFPDDRQIDALLLLEDAGRRHGIAVDAHSARYSTHQFIERVRTEGILIK